MTLHATFVDMAWPAIQWFCSVLVDLLTSPPVSPSPQRSLVSNVILRSEATKNPGAGLAAN